MTLADLRRLRSRRLAEARRDRHGQVRQVRGRRREVLVVRDYAGLPSAETVPHPVYALLERAADNAILTVQATNAVRALFVSTKLL